MKTIIRMLFFSALALYLTSLWNKGFTIHFELSSFLITSLLVAILYYVIRPITKIILLPFNIITFGIVSLVLYCFLFYVVTSQFSAIQIKEWTFTGLTLFGINIPKMQITPLQNIALSSLSVSYIISILGKLI